MAKQSAKCPQCGTVLEVDPTAGERVVCPSCQTSLTHSGGAKAGGGSEHVAGQRLGDFEIVELIGRGGMGSVFRARQVSLDRPVALKVLSRAVSRDASFVARFEREARSGAAVKHANVIEMIAFGQDRGHHYIAMELVEGESLARILSREGRLPADRAVELMRQVAAALAEAHAAGIVHRDIKPSNLLVRPDGQVKVADFGLAKRTDGDVAVTQVGQALGTPLYIPPEVAAGKEAEPRSDLYSLGATFYHLLSGRPPFQGGTSAELAIKHVQAQVPPLADVAPDLPRDLCRIIHRLLRKNPRERYRSARELIEALDRADLQPGLPRTDATRPAAARRRPRQQQVGALAAVGGLVALVAIALVVWLIGRSGSRGGARHSARARTAVAAQPQRVDPREKQAQACYEAAERAVARKQWDAAKQHLDRLATELAGTRLHASHRKAIAALGAKTRAGLRAEAVPERPERPKPPKPLERFHGAVRALADGRIELRYDFTSPIQMRDWEQTAGPPHKLADGEVRFGGPKSSSLMHRGVFLGDIEVAGTWRILEGFQKFRDCSVNFCNHDGRYYAVSLASIEQKIFKDDGFKGGLAKRKAECPEGKAHRFRVVREGDAIKVWVDGEFRIEARDAAYRRGAVGLGAWFARAAFEELRIAARLDPTWLAAHSGVATQVEDRVAAARRESAAREAEARFAKALEPIDAMARAWDFGGALAALGGLKAEGKRLAARLAARRDRLERLARLKAKMIDRIRDAKPCLQKRSLALPGMNGELVGADGKAITAALPGDRTESLPWRTLKSRSARRLARLATDSKSADDWVAVGLLALVCEDPGAAETAFEEARLLGAKVDRHLDPVAAAAFAGARALLELGRKQEAAAALAALEVKFGGTGWLAAHKDQLAAARREARSDPAPEAPKPPPEAREPEPAKKPTPQPKPDVPVKPPDHEEPKPPEKEPAPGDVIAVRKDGQGDAKTIRDALFRARPGSVIEIQDDGIYSETVKLWRTKNDRTTLRGKEGCWPTITSARAGRVDRALLYADAKDVHVAHLVVAHVATGTGGRIAVRASTTGFRLSSAIVYCVGGTALETGSSELDNCLFISAGVPQTSERTYGPGVLSWRAVATNCIWLGRVLRVEDDCELRSCIMPGQVLVRNPSVALVDCIVGQVESRMPSRSVRHCDVYRKPPFKGHAKPGDGCFRADPGFMDPRNLNFRLKPDSPCCGKASDGGDVGCRFTPELLDMLEKARELCKKGVIRF